MPDNIINTEFKEEEDNISSKNEALISNESIGPIDDAIIQKENLS